MSRLRTSLVLIAAILCVGCAVSRDRAATIASREVARRELPLPKNYTVRVIEGFAHFELQPSYVLWVVEYRVPNRKDPLYRFYIDERNGRIDDFTDSRYHKTVPSRI